jgi:hypothetical protein
MCTSTDAWMPLIFGNEYRDSDNSGTITYEEFKNAFSDSVGPDSIPFDFNWLVA